MLEREYIETRMREECWLRKGEEMVRKSGEIPVLLLLNIFLESIILFYGEGLLTIYLTKFQESEKVIHLWFP